MQDRALLSGSNTLTYQQKIQCLTLNKNYIRSAEHFKKIRSKCKIKRWRYHGQLQWTKSLHSFTKKLIYGYQGATSVKSARVGRLMKSIHHIVEHCSWSSEKQKVWIYMMVMSGEDYTWPILPHKSWKHPNEFKGQKSKGQTNWEYRKQENKI